MELKVSILLLPLTTLFLALGVYATPAQITPDPALQVRSPESTGVFTLSVSISAVSVPSVTTQSNTPTSTCIPSVKPDKHGYVPPDACNALWNYYPSFGAAIVMSVAFGILAIVHIVQAAVFKKGFCWVIIMGVLWELTGYVTRTLATRHQQSLGLAIVSQLLILLAPLWVNAFDYMVLARMIYFFVPTKSVWRIKPSVLTVIFVTLDCVSFVVQAIGGQMAGPGQSSDAIMRGIHIYMGGIGLQEFFILIFLCLAIRFHVGMKQVECTGILDGTPKVQWRRMVYALYTSLTFITVRIIYRLIEFSKGFDASNPIPYHEVYTYVFDALPMLFAIVIWNVIHPGKILQGPDSILPGGTLRKIFCCCFGRQSRKRNLMQSNGSNDVMLEQVGPIGTVDTRFEAVDSRRFYA